MKQLDPKSVYLFFFKFIRVAIPVVLSLIVSVWVLLDTIQELTKGPGKSVLPIDFWQLFLFSVPLILIGTFFWAKLSYRFYRYELTDAGFKKESGVIYKRYVTIPYERIQNVDIHRGIIARILGLSTLQVQTAGFSLAGIRPAEGELPGVTEKEAELLRDGLIERSRQSKNQGV